MLERRSALAQQLAGKGVREDGPLASRLGELRGWSLVQVAGFPGTMARVEAAVAAECSLAPPTTLARSAGRPGLLLLRTGPEQLWLVEEPGAQGEAAGSGLEERLRRAIPSAEGVVTGLSHSRSRLFISGPRARETLAKGLPIDLHPEVFAIDGVALTGLDHVPVTLRRTGPDSYELWVMRTFAQTIWEWLTDAALEHGYRLQAAGSGSA